MDDDYETSPEYDDPEPIDGLRYLEYSSKKDRNEALRVWLAVQFMILNGRFPTPGECHAALDPLHRYIRSGTWLKEAEPSPPTPIKASPKTE